MEIKHVFADLTALWCSAKQFLKIPKKALTGLFTLFFYLHSHTSLHAHLRVRVESLNWVAGLGCLAVKGAIEFRISEQ